MIVSIPVIWWNATNEWASFGFQGGRAFGDTFHPEWLIRMILGQLLYITPWIALPAFWATGLALGRGPRGIFPEGTRPGFGWFLVMMGIPPIIFFTAVSAWHDTQFHFHWQAPGYMMLFILLGGWLDVAWSKHRRLILGWLIASAAISYLMMGILISHTATGWLRNVLPNGQTIDDPTDGAIEWRELGQWFDKSGITDTHAFVVGLDWTRCGQIDTPLAGRLPLACFAPDPRNIAFNIDIGEMVGRDGYIVARYYGDSSVHSLFDQYFDKLEKVADIDIHRGGFAEVKDLRVYKGTNFHMNRHISVDGGPTASIPRLPRTRITGLIGMVHNEGAARTISVELDGDVVGTLDLAAGSDTPFTISVDAPKWTVGSIDVPLVLQDTNGGSDGLGLTQLAVTAN